MLKSKDKYHKRISVKWVKISEDKLEGIVTLERWDSSYPLYTTDCETFICSCDITNSSIGLSGIDGKCIVPLSEEEKGQLFELIRWYFDGMKKSKEVVCWFMGE